MFRVLSLNHLLLRLCVLKFLNIIHGFNMGFLLLITYGPIMQYVDLKLNTSNFYMQGKQKICMYLFLNDYSLNQFILDGKERVI